MRRILIPLVLVMAMLGLFFALVGGGAMADNKDKDPTPTDEPKPTATLEPTKPPDTPEPTKPPETPDPKDNDKDGLPDDVDPDDDNDGVLDEADNCQFTPNTDQANADGDKYGDACDKDDDGDGLPDGDETKNGTDPQDPDSDKDSCADGHEVGLHEQDGGRRDPLNHWDFYDTNGDQTIDLFEDIFSVAGAFGPAGDPKYDSKLDRTAPPDPSKEPDPNKREPWDLGPPDSGIDLFNDVFGVAVQFGHACDDKPKP
ncbi:MAG: flexitail domain-containing putative surface protein [Dehalococcoidia bacterium]|nr:flexitail domain-containing putative surface protein [Dehalococcoidia bacterium]